MVEPKRSLLMSCSHDGKCAVTSGDSSHSRGPSASPAAMETLEPRQLLSSAIEPITGMGNNLANPTWGSAGSDLLRLSFAAYADGIKAPNLPDDASARAISNIVNDQADPNNPGQDLNIGDPNMLSDFGY